MTLRGYTITYMFANLIVTILWDAFAYCRGGASATISRILWDGVSAYPGMALCIGGLLGHLFFSQKLN